MDVVFDSSSLISVSQSCLINSLRGLRGDNSFVVPKSVYYEVVERPLQIKRFELNAVRIKKAVDDGWLEIKRLDAKHKKMANDISSKVNNLIYAKGKPVKLIHSGEIEALALLKQLESNTFVIDERTTRTIIENPKRLKELIERRRHTKASINVDNAGLVKKMFDGLNVVRSVELIALAFERGLIARDIPKSKQALEAALYAVKFAGCAVSGKKIEEFLSDWER